MEDRELYIDQQKSAVKRLIPDVFHDALGSVELQPFEKFYFEIKDAGLGWLITDVSLIYIDGNDWGGQLPLPLDLAKVTWPNVKCTWDHQNLLGLSDSDAAHLLEFEIGTEIEFDSVLVDDAEQPPSLHDELSIFAMDILFDTHGDDVCAQPEIFEEAVEKEAKILRKIMRQMFREKCNSYRQRKGVPDLKAVRVSAEPISKHFCDGDLWLNEDNAFLGYD